MAGLEAMGEKALDPELAHLTVPATSSHFRALIPKRAPLETVITIATPYASLIERSKFAMSAGTIPCMMDGLFQDSRNAAVNIRALTGRR